VKNQQPVAIDQIGEYDRLRRDYGAEDFVPTAHASGIVKSVYVQINVAPDAEVEEVRWVQSVADIHDFPHAIVGYADLSSPTLERTLDQQGESSNFRGIRQQLHWHENPAFCFATRPDLMNLTNWRRGLARLAERGLIFELQVFASQMNDAARLVADFPGLTFVLAHAGMLEDTSARGWTLWRDGMRALAAHQNVMVKLSGLGTFSHQCSVPLWQPIVRETLNMFGAERCLFGSNFPIESLWTTYDQIVAVMQECVADRRDDEQRAIFSENARRVYRL
jgi:predicted TIM-barrel fold metal-dependent hydrolase